MLSAVPWVRPLGLRTLLRHMMHNVPSIFLPYFEEVPFLNAIQVFIQVEKDFVARIYCLFFLF